MMLVYLAAKKGVRASLVIQGRHTNKSMPAHTVRLVQSAFRELGKKISGSRICVMGLTYKGETDDVRETAAREIVYSLKKLGARVVAYDPHVKEEKIRKIFGQLEVMRDPLEAATAADCLVVSADHMSLRSLNVEELIGRVKKPAALVDGRNVFNPAKAKAAGFVYRSVGRPAVPEGAD
jgi:nucleotide sugar dehydrogenase